MPLGSRSTSDLHRAAQGLMSDLPENRDPEAEVSPTPSPEPQPEPQPAAPQDVSQEEPEEDGDDGAEDAADETAGGPEAQAQGGAPVPGQPGLPGQGKRRRRRRRRRGNPVLFTPEGQAYRVVAGPRGAFDESDELAKVGLPAPEPWPSPLRELASQLDAGAAVLSPGVQARMEYDVAVE